MNAKEIILHIPSWFPNEEDAFAGDFIVRHLQAIQAKTPILALLFEKNKTGQDIQFYLEKKENISCLRICYPVKEWHPYWRKWRERNALKYAVQQSIHYLQSQQYKINAVHSHVLHPAASIARTIKTMIHCPWIHSEHWSALTKENGEFQGKSPLFKRYYKQLIRHADAYTFVSDYLQKSFHAHFKIRQASYLVSNTVDTSLFYPTTKKNEERPFRYIHISSLGNVKQVEGIIEAFIQLNLDNAELWLVGGSIARNDALRIHYANEKLQFLPAQDYASIAALMQESDALVLNSLYETQSCVAIEALCCGLPVIAPNVAALPEFLNADNAYLFEQGKIEQGLIAAFNTSRNYARMDVAAAAQANYSFEKIGKEFLKIYQSIGVA